jgi:hypothetical protein
MRWIAPSGKHTANGTLEKRLWEAADQFDLHKTAVDTVCK